MSGIFSPNPAANTLGIAMFDAAYYLSSNPDVLAAVTKGGITAQEHFVQFGRFEGRDPTAFFNTQAYVAANPDVANLLGTQPGFTAWDHFINFGVVENRGTGAFEGNFDAQAYLAEYSDVADAVAAGVFRSAFEHFIEYGIAEDREGYTTEGESLNPNFPNLPVPETFALTTGVDVFTGNEVDDVFNAQLALGIDGLVGVQTLQGPDVLDGGAGVNILNADLNGTGTTSNPTISNIQQYYLTSFAGVLGNGMLDLSRATGYEQLWNRDSRVDLQLDGVGEVAILGMDNVRDESTYEVNYDNIAVETQVVVATQSGRPGELVELEINGVLGDITNLELNVSNGVFLRLDNDAADIANLTIAGTGPLDLTGEGQFDVLVALDSTGYDGNLTLDVSGSEILESVVTGAGDDVITVNGVAADGGLSVDLGAGFDILSLDNVTDDDDLSAVDFTGGVTGVENIAFAEAVTLSAEATLDLDGVSDDLETVWFFDGLDGNGHELTLANSPVGDLRINSTVIDWLDLDAGNVVNLEINTSAGELDLDALVGEALETLVLNQAGSGDLYLDVDGTLDVDGADALAALREVTATAEGDADVDLALTGELGDAAQLGALTTVSVTGTNARLNMAGRDGIVFVAGVHQVEQFTVDVTAASNFATSAGNIIVTSGDLANGFIATDYSSNGFSLGGRDNNAAADVASDLDASADLSASVSTFLGVPTGNVVTVEWATAGAKDQLNFALVQSTDGSISSPIVGPTTIVTPGADEIPQVDGEGFEAVETITVNAQDGEAAVNLTDVYGAFTLDVTATDNANVTLSNTGVTSATVTAGTDPGDTATVTVSGDTVGNAALVNLTVSGDEAAVTLSDDLSSFTTLDVSGVVTNLVADTSGAEFVVGAGQFIEYLIGATSDVDFTGNLDAREVYNFVGGDIGNVVITDFTAGADPVAGDRLDLSDFANGAGQLVFTQVGGNVEITDIAGGVGDFEGTITIVGATTADLAFNILYA